MTDTPHGVQLLGDWLSWDPANLVPSRQNLLVPFLTWSFANLQPTLAVELGSRSGETFRVLCQISDRFTPGGRLVAIDPWTSEPRSMSLAQSAYEGLRDYCQTRHADRATVVRAEFNAAVGEFAEGSIDFLHIARAGNTLESSPLDLTLWAPKLRPGGLVFISGADAGFMDDATMKVWQQVSEAHPSMLVRLPRPIGVAQIPCEGRAPLVEFLLSAPDVVSSFFRLMGERTEYRYLLGSDPVSARGLQKHMADLERDHAEELGRSEDHYRARLETIEQELASASEQLLRKAYEAHHLQGEADFLLAQLASRSSAHEQEVARLQGRIDELQGQRLEDWHNFQQALADRDSHIGAITATLSWRLTRPLRVLQALLIRTKLVRRSG